MPNVPVEIVCVPSSFVLVSSNKYIYMFNFIYTHFNISHHIVEVVLQ